MTRLRREHSSDADAIRAVHAAAFAPSEVEAPLVDALRAAGELVPELCLVAEREGELVGHVAISRAWVGDAEVLALGPIGVLPTHQRTGVGGALIRAVIEGAGVTAWPLIAVLGHAEYYPRFGFEPAEPLGIAAPFPVASRYWMAYRLPAYRPELRGTFRFADAFPDHA